MPPAPVIPCLNNPLVTYVESNYVETSTRPEGHSDARHCQVEGALREEFTACMLGWSEYDPDFGVFRRFPPEFHPRRPWLIARTCDFVRELSEPNFTGPGLTLDYPLVEMAVGYEATPGIRWLSDLDFPEGLGFPTDPEYHEAWRYVEAHSLEWDIENRLIPRNQLLFNDATDTPVPDPGVQLVPSATLLVKWFQVPAVLDTNGIPQLPGVLAKRHANCQGRVNSLLFFGHPPLTLYCNAPKRELVMMANGNLAWNFTFQFLKRGESDYGDQTPNAVKTDGPNWFRLLTGDGQYQRVYRKSDATKTESIYRTHDLYNLFRVGTPGFALVVS